MTTIGSGGASSATSTTATTSTSPATGPGVSATAPVALRDPRLSAHAQALAGVAAGTGTLSFGASGAHVRAIEHLLRDLGYNLRAPTGQFDRNVQAQLAAFQRQHGLTPSGAIDQATLAKLDEVAASGARPGAAAPSGGRPVVGAAPVQPATTAAAVDPLAGKPYMDATTFASMPPYQWARDSVELEAVDGVKGIDSKALLDILRSTNNAGRTVYQRLRRPEMANAFTLGYEGGGIDDLRWDGDSHALRERMKFVSLTVEDGRYPADPSTGAREVSIGTDKMDDTYYDTAGGDLLENGFSVRGRARWDTDTEIRRILVGVKANSSVDELGTKRNDKTDVRNDGASPQEIAALDADVRRGKTSWNGRDEAVKPLKGVYDALRAKGALPDIGTHEDVLLLEPKVHIRSVRSRYHMNETELADVRKAHTDGGAPKIQVALDLAAKAKARGGLSGQETAQVTELEALGRELLAMPKMPDRGFGTAPATFDELERDRALAESYDRRFHEFAGKLDGARRVICDAREQTYEGHARLFATWQRSTDKTLASKGAYDPFLAKYDRMTDADRQAFNTYGEQQRAAGNRDFRDFAALDAAGWAALRPALLNETVRIHTRMIEGAGSAARALWFDESREFYVPGSSRNTSNFIIDTFDMSEYVNHADWESIPEAQRTPASALPRDKVFHTSLVAEAQIELGLERPYLDRLKGLQGQIDGDRASLAMKWMTAGGRPGIDPANPATYGVALAALLNRPPAELDAEVARLNDFMRAQGSALKPLAAADLKRLDPALLTVANRDKAVRGEPTTERMFDGARFVFDQYVGAQKFLSDSKGDRVLRMLRDAGAPRGITWETTDAAKGETALKMLAGNP